MRRIIVKIWAFALLFPIKVAVAFLNAIRSITKSKGLDKFISEFRTKIQNEFGKINDKTYLVKNASSSNAKLVCVDIGARDGLLDIVEKNKQYFGKIILCEGEPEEAKKLSAQGYLVIDKFLAEKQGPAKFYYIKEHPGASSLKRPGTPFLHLFSDKHFDLYSKYTESDIITGTLDAELKRLKVNTIDFIKLDVQGSELSIIKGLTTVTPLFWEVEILPLPTYEDTPYGISIKAELLSRGYISLRQRDRMCKDGIYIYSNEIFMPDYTTDFGRNLILKNLENWKLMMELFDVNALAAHIETQLKKN